MGVSGRQGTAGATGTWGCSLLLPTQAVIDGAGKGMVGEVVGKAVIKASICIRLRGEGRVGDNSNTVRIRTQNAGACFRGTCNFHWNEEITEL